MSAPTWDEYMLPVLQALSGGDPLLLHELYATVAGNVGLSEDEMREVASSGIVLYKNRISWAVTYLNKIHAIERPKRATYAITERGRQLLAEGVPVTTSRLADFPEYSEFVRGSRQRGSDSRPVIDSPAATDESPQEMIERASWQLRAALEADLLERLTGIDPFAFERLVIKVLGAMGYGKDGSLAGTSASRDGGVDGVISQDPLGLDRIYLQAKRFSGTVHSPDIQRFIGALSTNHGDRGVFITTSTFSDGAVEAARRSMVRVELIDGEHLVRLMVNNGVGVQPESVTTIYRIDEDFFEEL